jgi:hypothetical protein
MAALEDQRYRNEEEITALVRGFENCTLPFARWTHEAHLTVAIFFLSSLPTDEATEHIREGIQRYNLANGVYRPCSAATTRRSPGSTSGRCGATLRIAGWRSRLPRSST